VVESGRDIRYTMFSSRVSDEPVNSRVDDVLTADEFRSTAKGSRGVHESEEDDGHPYHEMREVGHTLAIRRI
jgi:hypothetical protein